MVGSLSGKKEGLGVGSIKAQEALNANSVSNLKNALSELSGSAVNRTIELRDKILLSSGTKHKHTLNLSSNKATN